MLILYFVKKKIIANFLFRCFVLFGCIITCTSVISTTKVNANAFPFYDLCPQNLVLRSEFCTYFTNSSKERKNNIKRAVLSIDKTFVDVNGEFSFNKTVGPRTEKRGYENSKIIVNGQFVDGVGGGVCQVSTTLYNALILSGLKITEL